MATFSNTAAYFEARAKKAKSQDRRQQFFDAARFYEELGQITPEFPEGCKQPERLSANASLRADRLRDRAEECRAIADSMQDESCKAKLLRLADTYEQVGLFLGEN